MNSNRRFVRILISTVAVLILAGCWKERILWSPDAKRAMIIGKDGLRLCDAEGKLSPLLVEGAYRAAWLPDSQRFVVASSRKLKDYVALEAALGSERTRALATKAGIIWQRLEAQKGDVIDFPLEPMDDVEALMVYLREHHHEALIAKMAKEPKDRAEIEATTVTWHSLAVARIVASDRLEFGPPIYEGLASVADIRPTPSGAAVAFVTPIELSPDNDSGLQLFVAPLDRSAPPSLLSTHVAAHPDWTPDSRSLVYLQAEDGRGPSKPDSLRLGTLVERSVVDERGHVTLDGKGPRELAGLIFQNENRVRCLRDGRVLFDAAEFHLPLAGSDRSSREQLFALDRTKEKAAVVPMIPKGELDRLPNPLALFEVSPDDADVLFGGGGDVSVLHLADAKLEHFAVALVNDDNGNPPLPSWRRPAEFSYLRKASPRAELVLRHGETETVLSRGWPDDVLKQLAE